MDELIRGVKIIIQKVSETSADGWMNLYWRGQILKCESAISERSAVVVLGHSPSPPPKKKGAKVSNTKTLT